MKQDLVNEYSNIYESVLTPIARKLEENLKFTFDGVKNIDRISCRAKTVNSFINKALKCDEQGVLKYQNPLTQIQDQIGARIIVFYRSDVDIAKCIIDDYFSSIEWSKKEPASDMEFSYFGEHYICSMLDDAVPAGLEEQAPQVFELQIKTLFQHAWSEAGHDLAYKPPRPLTSLERRNLALSAAQAWGADQIFAGLSEILISSEGKAQDA